MNNLSLKETAKDHAMALAAGLIPTFLLFWAVNSLTLREDWVMAAIMALTLHLSARFVILHLKVQRMRADIALRKSMNAQSPGVE